MGTRLLTATAAARSATAIPVFAQNILELNAITTDGANYFCNRVQTSSIRTAIFNGAKNKVATINGIICNANKDAPKCNANERGYSDISDCVQIGITLPCAITTWKKVKPNSFKIRICSGEVNCKRSSIINIGKVIDHIMPPKIFDKKVDYFFIINDSLEIKCFDKHHKLKKMEKYYANVSIINLFTDNLTFTSINHIGTSDKINLNNE